FVLDVERPGERGQLPSRRAFQELAGKRTVKTEPAREGMPAQGELGITILPTLLNAHALLQPPQLVFRQRGACVTQLLGQARHEPARLEVRGTLRRLRTGTSWNSRWRLEPKRVKSLQQIDQGLGESALLVLRDRGLGRGPGRICLRP